MWPEFHVDPWISLRITNTTKKLQVLDLLASQKKMYLQAKEIDFFN